MILVPRFVFILHISNNDNSNSTIPLWKHTNFVFQYHKHIQNSQKTKERQYRFAEKRKTGDLQNVQITGI